MVSGDRLGEILDSFSMNLSNLDSHYIELHCSLACVLHDNSSDYIYEESFDKITVSCSKFKSYSMVETWLVWKMIFLAAAVHDVVCTVVGTQPMNRFRSSTFGNSKSTRKP
jgi:hypothetical protein